MEPGTRHALLVEIRAHRIRQRCAPATNPVAQLPARRVQNGFAKYTCVSCPNTVWQHVEGVEGAAPPSEYPTCGACRNADALVIDCAVCCSCAPRLPIPCSVCCKDYCRQCLATWASMQIEEGATSLKCLTPGCAQPISAAHLKYLNKRGLLTNEQLRRFKENKSAGRVAFLKFVLSGEDPALTEWARGNTQACPHCFALVQRSTGCNHMTVSRSCVRTRRQVCAMLQSLRLASTRLKLITLSFGVWLAAVYLQWRVLLHMRCPLPTGRPRRPCCIRATTPQPAGLGGHAGPRNDTRWPRHHHLLAVRIRICDRQSDY
jgi:hypothetical protein